MLCGIRHWHKQQCISQFVLIWELQWSHLLLEAFFYKTGMSRVTARTETSIRTEMSLEIFQGLAWRWDRCFTLLTSSRACFAGMIFFIFIYVFVSQYDSTFVEWRGPWSCRHFCLNCQMGRCINSLYNCVNLTRLLRCSYSVYWPVS